MTSVKPVNRTAFALRVALAALAALTLVSLNRSPLPRRWTEVREGWLFRSAQIPAGNVEAVLRDQQIDLVIDLTDDPNDPDFEPEAAAARALGIRYLNASVPPDEADAVVSYSRAVAAIEQARVRGDRVLVHCEIGHRRSAAAIALYALLVENVDPPVAYRELYRYADGRATWQMNMEAFIQRNLPELERRVAAALEESACASQPSCS
jgi:rhodanese-related sulfurtransferase